jgi:hypothetical protein
MVPPGGKVLGKSLDELGREGAVPVRFWERR